jgi:parallel beta-helix repeat protein
MQTKSLLVKGLAVGIILLFIGTSVIPSNAQYIEKPSLPASRSHWLFVGGYGPGNYSKIQDAINHASDGDTVFVFSGLYYENLIVDKRINIIGEDRNSAIIDGSRSTNDVITIVSSNVLIKGFTIRNSLDYSWGISSDCNTVSIDDNIIEHNSGAIKIRNCQDTNISRNVIRGNHHQAIELNNASNSTIYRNTITQHYDPRFGGGISLFSNSNYNTVVYNIVGDNHNGIVCVNCNYNKIHANKITYCQYSAIYLSNASNNEINSNILSSLAYGIDVSFHSEYNNISMNNISSGRIYYGIFIDDSSFNKIYHNNFLQKTEGAHFFNCIWNNWNENFWYKTRSFPKPIFGVVYINFTLGIPWINFDWHPAQEPYDIPGMR